MNKSGINRIW